MSNVFKLAKVRCAPLTSVRQSVRIRSRQTKGCAVPASVAGFLALLATVAVPWISPVQAAGTGSIYNEAATFKPLTGGHVIEPLTALPTDLAEHHYIEEEFSASGTAHAFRATSSPSDGKWTIEPTSTSSYSTRVLVRRPANPRNFSGTVVVEWMNVSAGESAPDWDYLNPEIMDARDAWVGVSAQALGVDGGSSLLSGGKVTGSVKGLVQQEPERYGTLHHPGDQYSFDIYDQVAFGLRDSASTILGPLRMHHILAVGESQSAFYLTTFADAIEPHDYPYDGIFIHSRGASGAPLEAGSISRSAQTPLRIRTDLRVPVFMSETQTDLIELGYAPAQQPNTNRIRTWEIAGTSHADIYEVGGNASVLGCTTPINTGPQHVVVQAAFADFSRWVIDDTPPPSPAPFRLSSTDPPTLALDEHGNVIGGVRTPAVDVPVATLTGSAPAGTSEICSLFGTTTPFSAQELSSLYGTKANYLSKYSKDLDHAIAARYLLPSERSQLMSEAEEVQFPSS
jgi:Alpha/beta hydrolase domain